MVRKALSHGLIADGCFSPDSALRAIALGTPQVIRVSGAAEPLCRTLSISFRAYYSKNFATESRSADSPDKASLSFQFLPLFKNRMHFAKGIEIVKEQHRLGSSSPENPVIVALIREQPRTGENVCRQRF
jgi:hypothetical protein